MVDRELLELAAKAADISLYPWDGGDARVIASGLSKGDFWNPLTDDGDALRLAVKLELSPGYVTDMVLLGLEKIDEQSARLIQEFYEDHRGNKCSATRRAVVRAAAEIGRNKEQGDGGGV